MIITFTTVFIIIVIAFICNRMLLESVKISRLALTDEEEDEDKLIKIESIYLFLSVFITLATLIATFKIIEKQL